MDMDMAVANVAVFPCTSCKRQARRAASLRPAAQQYTRVGDLSTKVAEQDTPSRSARARGQRQLPHNRTAAQVHIAQLQRTSHKHSMDIAQPNSAHSFRRCAQHANRHMSCHMRPRSGRSQLYTAVRIAAMDAGSNASTNGMAKCCFDTRGISNLAFDSSSSGSKAAAVARMLSLA